MNIRIVLIAAALVAASQAAGAASPAPLHKPPAVVWCPSNILNVDWRRCVFRLQVPNPPKKATHK
jgi:hypothetical protein